MKSKNIIKSWRLVFALIVIVYVIVAVIFISSLVSIPKNYSDVQQQQTIQVKKELENAIDSNNKAQFEELENKNAIEFVVMNEKEAIIYSTIQLNENSDFKNALNKNAIFHEEYYEYRNNESIYSVWLLQYYLSPQDTFDNWSLALFLSTTVLVTLNFIVVVILFTKFIRPLERLKDNVFKISKYQLDLINENKLTEYDQISNQLVHFAKELEKYIDNSTAEYTTLEKNLQIQNEKLEYKNKWIASMTHDLKAPLNIITLQAEKISRSEAKDILNIAQDIQYSSQKLVDSINEINQITYTDNYNQSYGEINFIELLFDILADYQVMLDKKRIDIDVIITDEIIFNGDKYSIEQIIKNAISNICSYTVDGGEAIINCSLENNSLYLNFYNDCTRKFSDEELENVFKLFFRYAQDNSGTGTGLYTIKRLVEIFNGQATFVNKGNGVELQIRIEVERL